MNKKVVITGMGIMCSIGDSISDYTESLRSGKCGLDHIHCEKEKLAKVDLCAEIEWEGEKSLKKRLAQYTDQKELAERVRKTVRRSSYPMQWAALAALEAWNQSGLEENVEEERVGLIVSGSNLNQHLQYDLTRNFFENPEYIAPRYALNYMDTDFVGTLSEIFGIKGESFTIGGASASGNTALIKAMQQIQMGITDICMVVGGPAYLSQMELQAYVNIGAMDGKEYDAVEEACRPFDVSHSGFLYGQAAGCIILESEEHAAKRNAGKLGALLGGKMVLDSNSLTNPNVNGEIKAMKGALENAGVNVADIGYINTHGTASVLGDNTEVEAIRTVFSENTEDIYINSTKGYTGHCLYSAGVVEMIASVIQMNECFVHGNKNMREPIDNKLKFTFETVSPVSIDYAISNAFGFGGINTCIVLGRNC